MIDGSVEASVEAIIQKYLSISNNIDRTMQDTHGLKNAQVFISESNCSAVTNEKKDLKNFIASDASSSASK